MNVTQVPLLDTGIFNGLTKAYLSHEPKLNAFYNHRFSIENFEKAIAERNNFKTNRSNLYDVIHQQHAPFYDEYKNLASTVNLIKDNHTFTITTGHQICLATGPLYFIYKIASAINLCQQLKEQYPHYNFVPVYWMATEDHDFEEINHIHLFDKKISWNVVTSGATGRISMAEIDPFLNEIKEILGDKIAYSSFIDDIFKSYQNHKNLAEATRALVLKLFADKGLLVLDADHHQLKKDFSAIIKRDIFEQVSFHEVSNTIEQLTSQNIIKEEKIQVKPRQINFFYLKDNLRKRIINEGDLFKVIDTDIVFSATEILEEIEEFPERFSPNVIMRPVYQEFILPNLTYIGGAGELSYWFELKAVFDAHQCFFPMLALRNSFLWIDKKQSDKLNHLGIGLIEVFNSLEVLIDKVLKNTGAAEINFTVDLELAHHLFNQIKIKIQNIEPTLGATADAERQKLIKSINILANKLTKAQKVKHEIVINQLKKIKESLFPNGGIQERYENIIWLNWKFGNGVIDEIIALANLESNSFTILSL